MMIAKRHNLFGFLILLFILAASLSGSLSAQTSNAGQLPGNHARWIGTFEGPDVDPQGSGVVYDFTFNTDGTVMVEKSMTVRKLRQTFNWVQQGKDIAISGDPSGTIGELSNALLNFKTDRSFAVSKVGGAHFELRKSKILISWLHIFFLLGLLMAGNELSRHSKYASYVLYLIIPVAFIPLWMNSPFTEWFRWIKLYSAIIGAAFFTLYRFNGLDKYKWAKYLIAAILAINISEAVLQDWSHPDLPNKLNAIAGLLNLVTISRWMTIKRDELQPHDMLWPGMTIMWILAYDFWNLCFVYLNFPNTVAFTLVVIAAPTIAAIFIKKGTWLQARGFTLAIYMMYLFTFKNFADNNLGLSLTIPLPRSEGLALSFAIFSLAFNVVYFVLHYRWKFTGKAPANLQVGQSESVIGNV